MRIGLQTWGSEGDIRPFVALGAALTKRGHSVEMLYTDIGDRRYEAIAESLGFRATAIASPVLSAQALAEISERLMKTPKELARALIVDKRMLEPVIEATYEAGLDLCRRCDLFVHHFILHSASAAAEKAGVPRVTVSFAHMVMPSRFIHPHGLPNLGRWAYDLEWALVRFALNRTLLKGVNRFRARVALPPRADLLLDSWPSHLLNLIAASPALIDRPPDWPEWHQPCGFLELPPHGHETVSPEVEQFLGSGPAPVFMGFGSVMPPAGWTRETVSLFEDAARIAGCRAIVQSDGDHASTDRILHVKRTPHRLVFPRCAAVVHHAGAGTTHATLHAGTPSVPVPHLADQFGWSDELRRLGVAPKSIRRTELTAKALAARITEASSTPSMKAAAVRISERMKHDDGPERAADLVTKLEKTTRQVDLPPAE